MREQQRMEKSPKKETPLLLMRMALGLLDRSGDGASATACHLQAAIDAASGEMVGREGDRPDKSAI